MVARRRLKSRDDTFRFTRSEKGSIVNPVIEAKHAQIFNSFQEQSYSEREFSRFKSVRSCSFRHAQPSSPRREPREPREPRDLRDLREAEESKVLREQRNFFRNCALGLVELLGLRRVWSRWQTNRRRRCGSSRAPKC